ncbi:hypothetical protein GALL_515030 [mine drainage metagenome]|uniref:Uncharacterized protein n=1 Tax=mine drainage metagenome TaxID=410659 RepID=A0A1J5PTP9_9ZZZZ
MASVSGIFTVKVVPWPTVLFRSMVPPIFSMLVLTTSMPTPRPDTAEIVAAVEKPARKINLRIWPSVMPASSVSVARPFDSTLARIRSTARPRPSSEISRMM